MQVICPVLEQGVLPDRFGKHGSEWFHGMPSRSFPLAIIDQPKAATSFSFIFDDPDSVAVCGFTWIHWMVANLAQTALDEDASQNDASLTQGMNSWGDADQKKSRRTASCYGGPAPPDRMHSYRLRLWALDCMVPLASGFTADELMHAMEGHIVAQAQLRARYSP